jgi:mono/diheme cytochrome c family protein
MMIRLRTLALASFTMASAYSAEVTFHRQVEPILQAHCQECHRAGEAAPMSLVTYKEARPWAASIHEAVVSKKMPPWFADPAHGNFQNDRRLSEEDIATLSAWARTGAKEGDPKDAPKPREFASGWSIGKPDAVIEMPNAFPVPATGTVEYQWIVVPTGFTEDKWVSEIELRPGDKSVVHHAVLFARPPGSKYFAEAKPGIPFSPEGDHNPKRMEDKGVGQFQFLSGSTEMVSVYVPGGVAYKTGPGQARLIKAGSDLIFQMHYTSNGKATTDRSRVGIVFAKSPPAERVVNTFIANFNLHIPPGDPSRQVFARVTTHENATLLSLFPHMHVRGKAFEYRATYPTGETETLLSVPKYDFNWQLTYYLAKPLNLPKGTKIECIATFDNSPNNASNPDPSKDVYWGEQTWEEMLAGFVDFAIPVTMNPNDIAREPRRQVAVK